jgi:hypothetical protein
MDFREEAEAVVKKFCQNNLSSAKNRTDYLRNARKTRLSNASKLAKFSNRTI